MEDGALAGDGRSRGPGPVQAQRQGVQRAPGHGRVGQGGQRQTVMRSPAQRHGGRRAGISAGPGRVERVPVQGSAQHRCWRPAPAGPEEGWGDGGQRVSDPGPGAGCRQRPFHRSVGRRVLQPADGVWFGRGPGRRFPGPGGEVQALAGRADELGPVTVRQTAGDERPRPGPAAGMPADLERAAAVRPAADRMDPDIKRAHASQPPQLPRYASAHITGSSSPPADPESRPQGSGGHQEGQRDYRAGCAEAQEAGHGRQLPASGIHGTGSHTLPAEYLHLCEGGRRRPVKRRSARSGRPQRYPLPAESCGTAAVSLFAIMGRDRPATGSRRGTCGLSWPGRADVTGTGDGWHGRESWFAVMLDL